MNEELDPAAHGLVRGDIVILSDTTKSKLIDSLRQETIVTKPELLSNTIKFTLLDSLRQDSNAKTEFNVFSNTAKPTLLESLSQESDYVVNALSNTTKPILLESLCQEPEFIENTLSNTSKFTLQDLLRQDSDLSIEAYSLLQEVCINCFKSKYMLLFYEVNG